MSRKKNIILCGVPRSGTSWVARVLSYPSSVQYIHEPDNERHNYLGYIYKKGVSRFPYYGNPSEVNSVLGVYEKALQGVYVNSNNVQAKVLKKVFGLEAEAVEKRLSEQPEKRINELTFREKQILLWYNLFGYFNAVRATQKRKLVKSVHATLLIPALAEELNTEIILLYRHPAGIIASQFRNDFADMNRPLVKNRHLYKDYLEEFETELRQLKTPLEKAGAQVGLMYYVMEKAEKKYDLTSLKFRELAINPVDRFKEIYQQMNLPWSEEIENYIQALNKKGEKFSVSRISDKQPEKWKDELSDDQIEQIKRGYSIFPTDNYSGFS